MSRITGKESVEQLIKILDEEMDIFGRQKEYEVDLCYDLFDVIELLSKLLGEKCIEIFSKYLLDPRVNEYVHNEIIGEFSKYRNDLTREILMRYFLDKSMEDAPRLFAAEVLLTGKKLGIIYA